MSACPSTTPADSVFMAEAVTLARLGLGRTAPNPCVGAVLVKGGRVVAKGWHKAYGGPHAEVECLADAKANGVDPAACVLYVTLEPCNHHGKTPPCTQAVLAAKIPKVVIGALDPNPDVTGGGAAFLREQGVEVVHGVHEDACRQLIADFLVWRFTPLPYVILKLAMTLDGRIAAAGGKTTAISSPASLALVHELRSQADAVLAGGATLIADDPRLTARPRGLTAARQPLAVIAARQLPGDPDGRFLTRERPGQTIFFTAPGHAASAQAAALTGRGVRIWELPVSAEGLSLGPGLTRLRSELSCHRVLCEGGGRLGISLLRAGLVHELILFTAPWILDNPAAVPAFPGQPPGQSGPGQRFTLLETAAIGGDVMTRYRPLGAVPGLTAPQPRD